MAGFQDRLMLPWTLERKENRQFTVILTSLLVLLVALSLWIPAISLPEKDRATLEKLPPQLAKLVVKKMIVKPEPQKKKEEPQKEEVLKPEKKKPEPEKKKPEQKKEPEKKPEKKEKPKKPEIKVKPKQSVKAARAVAKKTGLLALQDDLADLRSSIDVSALKKTAKPRKEKTIAAKASGLNSKKVLTRSSGIRTDTLSLPAESLTLAAQDREVLDETEDEVALARAEAEAALRANERSEESIRLAIEKLKASFYKLYNRELRKNPFLEGRLVLEVVIEASGEVSYCRVISSELNHKALESKIVNRMKLANFGSENVARATREVPLNFQPK